MESLHTPRTAEGHDRFLDSLNVKFNLQLPTREVASPSSRLRKKTLAEECVVRIKYMYFEHAVSLQKLVGNFEEWARPVMSGWVWKTKQTPGTLPSRPAESSFLHRDMLTGSKNITAEKRKQLLEYLLKLLDD